MSVGEGSFLLERDAEVRALSRALDRAASGFGGVLLIEGEAGVGKTALLDNACTEAQACGMTVLSARGGELEREFAWGVVRQLFEPRLADLSPTQRSVLLGGSAALAGPVFGREVVARGTPEEAFAALHGLYWLTVNLAREVPVVVAVDDLHWADRPSLRFAVHLAPRVEDLPIALFATSRPLHSKSASDPDLLARFAAESAARVLRPAPLSLQASMDFVRARFSAVADPEWCRACHEMSGGNPFLLGALVDALRAEGTEPTAESAPHVRRISPHAVARSVLVRLATLPQGCVELVRAVAVLGARADFRQARRLAGLDTTQAFRVLDALVRAGILRGQSTVEFVHPLVRSAVYHELTSAERADWHARAAQLRANDGAPAEEIAPHLLASLPDANQDTVQRLREAAGQARARGAVELAVDYLSRALDEPPGPARRAGVLLELGAAEALQRPMQAVAHLSEALEHADTAHQRATIALALGDALAASGRPAEVIPVLDRGLRELGASDSKLEAQLQAALIAAARWEPSAQSLRQHAVTVLRARAAAGEQLDPLLDAQLAIETAGTGSDRDVAINHARRVLETAPELTHGGTTVPEAALVLAFAGLPEEAWRAIQGRLEIARRLGWPLGIASASTCASLTALHLGWISEAVASARGAMTPGAETQLAPITLAFLIEALIERGDTAAARDELCQQGLDGELPPIWPTTPLLLARGRLRAAIGDHATAAEDLLATGERTAAWGLTNPAMTPWRSSAAISLAAIGERDEAIRLATEELELARRWGAARATGVALRAAGIAHGDEKGLGLLADAVRTLEVAAAPVEHARAFVDLGAALRRQGARSQARERLRSGLDLAHRHGAIALAERAREELVVAGARPRRDALRGRDALTSSELRVARLAAEGHTNNEIAQLLFITPRTVEAHLTSSYAKLCISSRRELSTVLHQDGGEHHEGASQQRQ